MAEGVGAVAKVAVLRGAVTRVRTAAIINQTDIYELIGMVDRVAATVRTMAVTAGSTDCYVKMQGVAAGQ
jgi:hypothetical protein